MAPAAGLQPMQTLHRGWGSLRAGSQQAQPCSKPLTGCAQGIPLAPAERRRQRQGTGSTGVSRAPGGQAGISACPAQGWQRSRARELAPGAEVVLNPAIQTELRVSKFLLLTAPLTWKPALCLPLPRSPPPPASCYRTRHGTGVPVLPEGGSTALHRVAFGSRRAEGPCSGLPSAGG